jgi:hypothetical protein
MSGLLLPPRFFSPDVLQNFLRHINDTIKVIQLIVSRPQLCDKQCLTYLEPDLSRESTPPLVIVNELNHQSLFSCPIAESQGGRRTGTHLIFLSYILSSIYFPCWNLSSKLFGAGIGTSTFTYSSALIPPLRYHYEDKVD